jgi:GDPmannose 4,6-dehydratase
MICVVTGITGQDGSFLAEKLTRQGHKVHGLYRRTSGEGLGALDHHTCDPDWDLIQLHNGDLTDSTSIRRMFDEIEEQYGIYPSEIYHMGAFTHVGQSYKNPELVFKVNTLGTLNILEAVKEYCPNATVYHAATSELFGGDPETSPQNEETPFDPKTPYAISKLAAYQLCEFYKNAYDMTVVQGILFNHESERRPKDFVTMKIVNGLCKIALGLQEDLGLGNLDARRDWGYAGDYVDAIIAMVRNCQFMEPENFVVGSGATRSVKDFVDTTAELLNKLFRAPLVDVDKHVYVDPRFVRENEVWELKSSPKKLVQKLGWIPQTSFEKMIKRMILSEMKLLLEEHPDLAQKYGHVLTNHEFI